MTQLRNLLKSITDFSESELDVICSCFTTQHIKKNAMVLAAGDICRDFYYVSKGCLRTYFMTMQGDEKTRLLLPGHTIGTALTSFISQKPSVEFMDALEDTELLSITHADFYRLVETMPQFRTFYIRILEMAYSFQNRAIENRVTLTAKQRFELVLESNPALIQTVSNKVLASYLDIRQETLSRLKSK